MEKNNIAISVSNLSKQYRLGEVGTGTISHDLNRWWHRVRGKEDPYLKIGETNDRASKGNTNYVWSLKDINLDVNQGEVLGVIGKNGAGKSTLLKVLSKITAPTTGLIKAKGRVASLLEVGTGFHPEMTGRENIYMNGTIMGMSRHEVSSKLDEIVAFAGIERYLDTPVKRYSSGMTVRLGFAIAAHLEPEILIVDEVLAVGDAEFQKKAIGKMKEVSEDGGRTVIFVSHNMGSIQNLCTKALVMDKGQVIFHGGVNEGVQYYLTLNKEKSTIPLKERNDRKGGNGFRFTDCIIKDNEGNELNDLLSGKEYCFEVDFESSLPIDDLRIRLQFVDDRGLIRFLCNNLFSAKSFEISDGVGKVYCNFKKFPLPKGTYSINLTAAHAGTFIDDIESVLSFEVSGGDFFGTGKQQISGEGVLVDHEMWVG